MNLSNIRIVKFTLELLSFFDLSACLHEVLLQNIVPFSTDGEHTGLCANVPHIGTVEVFANLGAGFVINFSTLGNLLRVNFEDIKSTGLVRKWDLNFSVESTWSEKCGIKCIGPVSCHNSLYLTQIIETI